MEEKTDGDGRAYNPALPSTPTYLDEREGLNWKRRSISDDNAYNTLGISLDYLAMSAC